MDWGNLVAAVVAIAVSVAALVKAMGSAYGAIITSLQHQNTAQQVQISSQQAQIDALRLGWDQSKAGVQKLQDALAAEKIDCDKRLLAVSVRVRKLENGGGVGHP